MTAIYHKINHTQVRYNLLSVCVSNNMYIKLLVQKRTTSSIGILFVYAQYFVVWKSHENQPLVTFSSSLGAVKYYYTLLDLNYRVRHLMLPILKVG
jgi:hypothetical protein